MNIELGRFVPKVRRTFSEASAKATGRDRHGSTEPVINAAAWGPKRLGFGSFVLDLERGCCLASGEELPLRPKSFDVLAYLVSNPGRPVSKRELLDAAWPDVYVTDDSVVQCIAELRAALGDKQQTIIKTVPRRGYRFEVTPEQLRSDAEPASVRPAVRWRIVVAAMIAAAGVAGALWWTMSATSEFGDAPPFSIAILPFADVGEGTADSYRGEGIAVDLITELSRLPGLFVISPATAQTLGDEESDPRSIGQLLNVRYVLTGTVHETEGRLRVNVQLVSAQNGEVLWADRLGGDGASYFSWQDELIGRIAISLSYRLTDLESDRRQLAPPENLAAFDLAVRGWGLVYAAKVPGNYETARKLFARALVADPGSVRALTGLGWTATVAAIVGWRDDREEAIAEANRAVAETLAVDADNIIAHHVRGFVFRLRSEPAAAYDAFRTAVDLSPSFAPGHAQLGATALELGRPVETIASVSQAMRLSPRDPSLGPWQALLGRAHLQLGQVDEAVVWLSRSVRSGTPVVHTHAYLASALALAGRLEEAKDELRVFRAAQPHATLAGLIARDQQMGPDFAAQNRQVYDGLRMAGLQ